MTLFERAHAQIKEASLNPTADPIAVLKRFLKQEGFSDLMAREMRNPFDADFDFALEIYEGPEELRQQYLARRDALFDVGMRRVRQTSVPLTWSSLRTEAVGPSLRIMEDLTAAGMRDGLVMAHKEIGRETLFVSIVGDIASDLSHEELLTIQLITSHFMTLWLTGHPGTPKSVNPLTAREVEVLAASSAGVQGRRLQAVLGISEHTLRSHLRSIREKLSARSLPHAVQLGIQHGFLTV